MLGRVGPTWLKFGAHSGHLGPMYPDTWVGAGSLLEYPVAGATKLTHWRIGHLSDRTLNMINFLGIQRMYFGMHLMPRGLIQI